MRGRDRACHCWPARIPTSAPMRSAAAPLAEQGPKRSTSTGSGTGGWCRTRRAAQRPSPASGRHSVRSSARSPIKCSSLPVEGVFDQPAGGSPLPGTSLGGTCEVRARGRDDAGQHSARRCPPAPPAPGRHGTVQAIAVLARAYQDAIWRRTKAHNAATDTKAAMRKPQLRQQPSSRGREVSTSCRLAGCRRPNGWNAHLGNGEGGGIE